MKFNKRKKGFSLVELLGVIVILGILSTIAIVSVSRLINKSRTTADESNEKTLKMAAQSYMSDNTEYMPKSIGETTEVKAETLRKSKYIQEDIKNSNGESCMKYSYVKIYKTANDNYYYTSYLYCGSETPENTDKGLQPYITLSFSDSEEVSNASFVMKLYGDSNTVDGKYSPNTIIDGYSYSISIKNEDSDTITEVYSSGTLSGNNKKSLTINKKFSDYIDVSSTTTFYVNATIVNGAGETYTIDSSTDVNSQEYVDTTAPTCVYTNGKADNEPNEDSWINKSNYSADRTITVYCSDNENGSGCKRSSFSKSWPYDSNGDGVLSDSEKGIEFGYIEIYDNRNKLFTGNSETGNRGLDSRNGRDGKKDCRVRVNVDLVSPSATLTAKSDNTTVLSNVAVNDNQESTTINADSYSNISGGSTKWLNKENYPNGITYQISVKDNLHLDHWTWETNSSGLNASTFNRNISLNNSDADKGTFTQPDIDSVDHGKLEDKITIGFKTDGMRYGKLTIYDAAGNSVSYFIYANLDRTTPDSPDFAAKNISQNTNYTFGTWSNDKTGVEVYVTKILTDSISGTQTYKYKVNDGSLQVGTTKSITTQGSTKITYIVCDGAENCSNLSTQKVVKLDNVRPTCTVNVKDSNGSKYTGGWSKLALTITATCSDATSKCKSSEKYIKMYNNYYNISNAGAIDVNNPGTFEDNAGNSVTCELKSIAVDTKSPSVSCKLSGRSISVTSSSDNSGSLPSLSYGFSTGDTPSNFTQNNTGSESCTNRVYGYVKAVDTAGNSSVVKCSGSYKDDCCNKSNPGRCNWITSCRRGTTEIHSAGTACHTGTGGTVPASFWATGSGNCTGSTKLYLYNGNSIGSGNITYVAYIGGDGGSRTSPNDGNWHYGYIFNNCIGSVNEVCAYNVCPG